ncbi:phosphorylase family protein [Streptomyces sp. NPDC001443]
MNGTRTPTGPVLVLTALPVEYRAVRERLVSVRRGPSHQGTLFEVGWLNGTPWQIVLAQTGAGNHASAVLASRAIEAFAPRALFFVGVAGGLRPDIALGDVVVPTKVYAYHGGKETGEGFAARPVSWQAPHELEQLARFVDRDSTWSGARLRDGAGHAPPAVHFKPIAAGEVVSDAPESGLRRLLDRHYQDAVAVEMEGAGVAQAAHLGNRVPALIVRGISDRADGTKRQSDEADWQAVAARNAAAFALCVVRELAAGDEQPGTSPDPYAFLDPYAAPDPDGFLVPDGFFVPEGFRVPAAPPASLVHRSESAPPLPYGAPAHLAPPPWPPRSASPYPPPYPSPPPSAGPDGQPWTPGQQWTGGRSLATPDCRYLLHDELLDEQPSPDHALVRHQAVACRLEPSAAGTASPYVWLRHAEVRQPTPDALEALAALGREHDLIGRVHRRARGLPGPGRYERIGDRRAVLTLPWPLTRSGRRCGTLHSGWLAGRAAPLNAGRLARLLAAVAGLCDTLAALHRAGATHRDLAPTGVLERDDGRLVLRDLGLAAHAPRPGEGPTSYRAPEQWRDGHRPGLVGPPADVYQLAALTYHLATGRPPESPGAPPPSSRLERAPDSLDRALRAALAEDPRERPAARALGTALRAARDDLLGEV